MIAVGSAHGDSRSMILQRFICPITVRGMGTRPFRFRGMAWHWLGSRLYRPCHRLPVLEQRPLKSPRARLSPQELLDVLTSKCNYPATLLLRQNVL